MYKLSITFQMFQIGVTKLLNVKENKAMRLYGLDLSQCLKIPPGPKGIIPVLVQEQVDKRPHLDTLLMLVTKRGRN